MASLEKIIEKGRKGKIPWKLARAIRCIKINGKFIGQFEYSLSDLKKAGLTLGDVGTLAWGNFIYYEPERKKWFSMLLKRANKNKNKSVKDTIDEINMETGKGVAIKFRKKFPVYWILTPQKNLAYKGHITPDRVTSLLAQGYTVIPTHHRGALAQIKSLAGKNVKIVHQ